METITVPKAIYDQLVKDSTVLARLEAAGVDNWEGYQFILAGSDEESEDDIYGA